MDIEHTLFLMTTRPRMFVINASGMYHFYSGVFSQKRESGISKDNEANLLVCFLEWKKKHWELTTPKTFLIFMTLWKMRTDWPAWRKIFFMFIRQFYPLTFTLRIDLINNYSLRV
ncbi:hypothetical protein [Bartonella sp. HY761]|uniref:hypothetical protein n=1 Tax=Bartonella sp. HY761 TaxID=2979330 RepID=UPI00220FDD84|nr:hypothetical protein [Bartonella sp. HY761]UXN06565.1 hypothetical protein N6A79_00635 [Bartonella sp. HY761]